MYSRHFILYETDQWEASISFFLWIFIVPLCSLSSTLSPTPTPTQPSLHNLLYYVLQLLSIRQTDRPIDPSLVGFFIDPMREFVSELCEIVHFLWLNSSSKNRVSGWWFYTEEQEQQQQQACCTKPWTLEGAILLVFCHVSALCHLLRTLCVCVCVGARARARVGFFWLFDDALVIIFFGFVVVWFRSRMCVVGTLYLVHDGGISLLFFRVGHCRFSGLCLCPFLWFTSLF